MINHRSTEEITSQQYSSVLAAVNFNTPCVRFKLLGRPYTFLERKITHIQAQITNFAPIGDNGVLASPQLKAGPSVPRFFLPLQLCSFQVIVEDLQETETIQVIMNFRNLFLSFFFLLAVGLALVHAEEVNQPRGPKITSKVYTLSTSLLMIVASLNVCSLA